MAVKISGTGLDASTLTSGSITQDKIASGSITNDKIASGSITNDKIASGSITSDKIASGSITSDKIASGSITSDKIASGSITNDKIASGAVTSAKMSSGAAVTNIGYTPVNSSFLVGQVGFFAMATAPDGWLKANGAAVSRTAYANLFAAIGIIYGAGDGTSTFNLPDLRGEFIRGWDNGRGVDSGRIFASSQSGGVPFALYHTSGRPFDGGSSGRAMDAYTNYIGTQSVANAGELRPRNVALLVCIKY